jgi:hypothetical protein
MKSNLKHLSLNFREVIIPTDKLLEMKELNRLIIEGQQKKKLGQHSLGHQIPIGRWLIIWKPEELEMNYELREIWLTIKKLEELLMNQINIRGKMLLETIRLLTIII